MDPEQNTSNTPQFQVTPPKRRPMIFWYVLIGLVVVVALITAILSIGGSKKDNTSENAPSSLSSAEKTFYEVLANAAQQPRMHVVMYREPFTTKDNADAGTNPE